MGADMSLVAKQEVYAEVCVVTTPEETTIPFIDSVEWLIPVSTYDAGAATWRKISAVVASERRTRGQAVACH
jgi:hypothetical protein